MTSLFSARRWRSLAIKILPEFIKGPIRKRLHGFTSSDTPLRLNVSTDEHGLRLQLEDKIDLRISEDFQHSLRYQCIDNADAIEETRAFLEISQNSKLLLDAGAYTGLFTLFFCALSSDKRAVVFEPSPSMLPKIEALVKANNFTDRTILENTAVGDTEGSIAFAMEEDTGFVQILSENPSAKKINVPITTIDNACAKLALKPDLLKIDVEGFELEALKGAEQLLTQERPIVFLELHLNYLETRGISPRAITDYLQAKDYRFYSCRGEQLEPKSIYDSAKPVVRFVARAQAK